MTITLPLKVGSYISAMAEAQEISLTVDVPVYLFRLTEGGYVIDVLAEVYSNEKLIMKLFKGARQ
jgi:hypothetical protein